MNVCVCVYLCKHSNIFELDVEGFVIAKSSLAFRDLTKSHSILMVSGMVKMAYVWGDIRYMPLNIIGLPYSRDRTKNHC